MADIKFIETDAQKIFDFVLETLEGEVNEPLYGGDERRIMGEAMAQVVIAIYNAANDACRQRLLRYARGTVLDALGENRDVSRLTPTSATTTLRFGVIEPTNSNIIIPAGLRVTGDFVRYFTTDSTVVLYAGDLSVDVTATAENGGAEYNDIATGALANIVDVSEVPLLDYVTNLTATEGGGDIEDDEAYRQRIRDAENKLSTAGTAKAYKYWAMSANSRVSDAVVFSETEKIKRTLKLYDRYAFIGGATLLEDTLKVYKPDGTQAMYDVDFSATYEDDLLTIEIYGTVGDVSEVNVEIMRTMAGRVKIVPICAGGEIPDEDVLADVLRACTSDDVKPLTDTVTVTPPDTELYDISLTYVTTKANESEVVQNVEGPGGAISRYINWQGSAMDRDINPDELKKLILSPNWAPDLAGATRVEIIKPTYKDLPKTTVAKFSGELRVQHSVKD
ncbi:MAG: baseplate J/gp47 family protein [Paludibacteraceae bacterium]|nr:baseplate J/gp47 family protein [Paludibacteraceae bacterium]